MATSRPPEKNQKPLLGRASKLLKDIAKFGEQTTVRIIAAVALIMMIFALVVTAAPIVSWVTTSSTNCLAQNIGNSMVDVNGTLYILFGNSTNFLRYNESTGNCVTTGADGLAIPIYPGTAGSGASLTKIDSNNILAISGGNASTSYIYNIPNNFWITFNRAKLNDTSTSPPLAPLATANAVNGNSIVNISTDFYILSGNGSSFSRFSQASNTSAALTAMPVSAQTGAALVYPGSGNFIYALQGGTNFGFYRYNISGNSWTPTSPGAGFIQPTPATVSQGGAMAMVGNDIYAFGGGGTKNFWRYDTTQSLPGSWVNLTSSNPPPDYVQGGGALTAIGNDIYAFNGNNTKNFWKYNTISGVWSTLVQTPDTVAAGGSLTNDGTNVYASRGRGSNEIWKYTVGTDTWSVLKEAPSIIGSNSVITASGGLAYSAALGEIYLATGVAGTALYRYIVSNNTWPVYLAAPSTPATILQGSAGAYPGVGDFLYFLRGTATKTFWKYNISQNIWIPWSRAKFDATTPLSQSTISSYTQADGNTTLEVGGKLYMIVGNSTTFLMFDPALNVWKNLPNLPASVASGASMIKYDNNTIYVGNGTSSLWKYDIPNLTWHAYPLGKTPNGKPFSQIGTDNGFGTSNLTQGVGNSIVEYNGKFYVIAGNSVNFLRYDPADNSWFTLANAPSAGTGSTQAIVGSNIYLLTGSGTRNFWKYDILTGIWVQLGNFGGVSSNVTTGGAITAVGTNLYAFRGGNTSEFWRYDTTQVAPGTWTQLGNTPHNVQGGGAMTKIGTNIYAFAGNGSPSFWKYDATQAAPGTWDSTIDPAPGFVSAGGSLTTDGTDIYATKGNGTTTFWKYNPAASSGSQWSVLNSAPIAVGTNSFVTAKGGIVYSASANGDIYMVSGNGAGNFSTTTPFGLIYRYQLPHGNSDDNTWPVFTAPSATPAAVGTGSSLTYPGTGNFLYMFKGGGAATDFWKYDVINDEWWSIYRAKFDNGTALSQSNLATNGTAVAQAGGTFMVEVNNKFYVAQGGNTKFQVFDPSANTWTNLPDPPNVFSAGASLVKIDNNTILANRGVTAELWKYIIDGDTTTAGDQGSWISFNLAKRDDGTIFSQSGTTNNNGSFLAKANNPITGLPEFYMTCGNNLCFEKFNPATNTWTSLAGIASAFQSGASVVQAGNNFYITQGTSNAFFQYSILQNIWTTLSSTNLGTVAGGGHLAYPGTGDFIYSIRGNNSTDFQRYSISGNSWSTVGTLASTPAAVQAGGSLAFIGNTLYAFRGNGTSDFWSYDITQAAPGTWTNLSTTNPPPDTVFSGGSLTSDGTYLYATRGNVTKNFWKYNPAATSGSRWSLLPYLPAKMGAASSTTGGGNIVYCSNCDLGEIWLNTNRGVNGTATQADPEMGGLLFRFKIDPVTCNGNGLSPGSGSLPCTGYNTWPIYSRLSTAPAATGPGSTMVYPASGDSLVYATQGASNQNFWSYNLGYNEWNGYLKGALEAGIPISQNTNVLAALGTQGSGNSIVQLGGKFYMLNGGATTGFTRYDPINNTWIQLANTPATVGDGASLTTDGTNIFALRGNTATDFWRYNPTLDNWTVLAVTPLTVGAGGSITYPGSGNFVYAFRGTNTVTFWRYDITQTAPGTWNTGLDPADPAIVAQGGAALVGVGGSDIYAIFGNNTNNFQRYNIVGNSWSTNTVGGGVFPALTWITASPVGVSAGGAMTYDGSDNLYIVKGGAATDFKKYTISTNTFTNMTSAPVVQGINASAQARGGIAYISSGSSLTPEIFQVTGNGVNSATGVGLIYRYKISTDTWPTFISPTITPGQVNGGGALATIASGNFLYGMQGGTTTNFWTFDTTNNEWNPNGFFKSKLDGGTALSQGGLTQGTGNSIVQTDGKFYVLQGATTNFQSYDPATNRWKTLDTLPAQVSAADGAALVSTDNDTIYALQGGTVNNYRYKISTGHWTALGALPATAGTGASLSYPGSGNFIYAMRGSNTSTMYKYDITQATPGSWTSGATFVMTSTTSNTFSSVGHNLPAKATITVSTSGTLPTGLAAATIYYVINTAADTFQVSLTPGGTPVTVTTLGTGTHSWNFSTPWTSSAGGASTGFGGNLYVLRGNNLSQFSKLTLNASGNGSWEGAVFTAPTANTITSNAHGLVVDSIVTVATTTTLPTGLTANTIYYVINPSATTFQVSTTRGGSAVSITAGTGSGTHYWQTAAPWNIQAGGSLTNNGTQIWTSRGSGTTSIRKYCTTTDGDCAANTWATTDIAAFPVNIGAASASGARGGISYIASGPSGGPELFGVSGNGVTGNANSQTQGVIYRYPFTGTFANTWPLTTPPAVTPATIASGGSLTPDYQGNLYATGGNATTAVYRYNLAGNSWSSSSPTGQSLTLPTPLTGVPLTAGNLSGSDSRGNLIFRNPDASGTYNGDEELYLSTGNGSSVSFTATTPGKGLLFRYPFSGTFAGTWPLIKTPAAQPTAGKTVGVGGALTSTDTNSIFAFRGNATNEFWRYDITGDTWNLALATPPVGTSIATCTAGQLTNCVSTGGSLTNDGAGNIYATRGGPTGFQTREFWKYNITNATTGAGTWTALTSAPVPFGGTTAASKGGITYYNSHIWGSPGAGKSDITETATTDTGLLYRYDITGNTWPTYTEASDVPTIGVETFTGGSSLTSLDSNTIYALQNNAATNRFWQYVIGTDTWTERAAINVGAGAVTIGSGGSIAATDANTIYATRGNNTNNVYKYNVVGNTWSTGPDFTVGVGEALSSSARGGISYSSTYNKLFGSPGNDNLTSPFSIYSLAVAPRAYPSVITAIPRVGSGFDVLVEAVDDQGNPFNVPANTNIYLSKKTGTGTLSGTVTGTILSGQNQVTITGVQYDVAESGVVINACNTITPTICDGTTLVDEDTSPFTVYAQPATLTNVAPPSGTASGGTAVILTGTNFTSATRVTIGGLPAESITFNSGTQLTIITPRHANGLVDVTVTNADNVPVTLANSFTFQAPTFESVTPNNGPTAGGNFITITGGNFGQTYYSKAINVTNPVPALINYSVNITIDTATLISSGKMRNDCGDLRIKDADQLTNLSYWLESGCNTTTTSVWAQIPLLPNGGKNLYLTYGRNNLVSQSSLVALFPALANSSNNRLWLKADNGTSQTIVDSTVSTWLDQSGNGFHATQNTSTQQPLYKPNQLNGKPIVRFDGTNDKMSFANQIITNQQFSIMMVGRSTTAGNRTFFGNCTATSCGNPLYFGQNATTLRFTDDFTSAGTFSQAIYNLFGAISSSSNAITYLNGAQLAAKGSPLSPRLLTNTYFLSSQTVAGAEFLNGDIAELLVFNSALSTTDRQAVEQYLNAKYNLFGSNPAIASIGGETANSLTITIDGASAASNITFNSEGSISASIPAHTVGGPFDIVVTNPDAQTGTGSGVFSYQTPTLISVNPSVGPAAGNTAVTLTGTNFAENGYIRPVTISNASGGTLTNYQTSAIFDTTALIIAGKVRSDCGDIRVKSSNRSTVLSYWIEPGTCNTATTKVWTLIPSLPTGYSKIYVTYGDPALTTLASTTNTFVREIDTSALRAYWSMDEAGGATVADTSGTGLNGTGRNNPNNANATSITTTGKFGNARHFDGSGEYVSVPTTSIASNITVSAWIRASNFNQQMFIVQKRPVNTQWEIYLETTSGLTWRGGSTTSITCSNALLTPNQWNHVVGKQTGTTATLYINGTQCATGTVTTIGNGAGVIDIGRHDSAYFFNGDIDEVAIFTKALSSDEVSDLYNNYAFATTNYPNKMLIRKFQGLTSANLESVQQSNTLGSETGTLVNPLVFGGSNATSVSWSSPTTVTARTPAHAVGPVDVVFTNPDSQSSTLLGGFNYLDAPTVTSISPTTGFNNQIYTGVTVNGSNFTALSGGTAVKLTMAGQPDISCSNVTIVNINQLTCDLNLNGALAGDWDVVVTNPDLQSATLSTTNEFIIANATPTISNINPNYGPAAGASVVTVTGTNFMPSNFSRTITVTSGTALTNYQTSFTLDTAALISAGKMRSDCGDLRVKDSNQSTDLSYWIEDSTCNTTATKVWTKLASIPNGSKLIYVTYGNLTLTTTANGNDIFEFFDNFAGPTLDGTKWPSTTGSPSVLTTPGSLTLPTNAGVFAGTSPIADDTIWESSAKPTFGSPQSSAIRAADTTARAWVGGCTTGNLCLGISFWSDQRLYGESFQGENNFGPFPYSTLFKTYKVTFRRAANTAIFDYDNGAATLTHNTNIVNSLPTNLFLGLYSTSGSTATVYDWIRIRKYTATEPNVSVGTETGGQLRLSLGGTNATNVVYVSPTQITATTVAHTAGLVDVVVTNPDNQSATLINGFTYLNPPTVTSIDPNNGTVNTSVTVTIGGTDFYSDFGGSTAKISKAGQSDINCSIQSIASTTIICELDLTSASLGNWGVTVTNPGNMSSTLPAAFNIHLAPPVVTSVDPNFGPPTGNTNVAINGMNFQDVGYQTPIAISNSGAAQTDYPVRFTLDTAAAISASKMRTDCGDLRIKDTNGTTDLNYWIESGCNTASTVVWAKVPSLVVGTVPSPSTTTIYANYGIPALTSQSNGDNTFLFFDDFETGTINTNKWVVGGSLSPYWIADLANAYQGSYSSSNGDIGDSQFEVLVSKGAAGLINVPSGTSAIIDFYWKVSSEGCCDFIRYCFDNTDNANSTPTTTLACSAGGLGTAIASISGTVAYARQQTTVSSNLLAAGLHRIEFSYNKDSSVSTGTDTGSIDALKVRKISFSGTSPITELVSNGTPQSEVTLGRVDFCELGTQTCTQLTNLTFINSTQLTANTPAHVAAAVDVRVTNADGLTGTLLNGFTYYNPNVDADNSTVSASLATVEADGVDSSTITVTIRDQNNNPLPNVLVEVNDNGSGIIYTPSIRRATTNASGVATLSVKSSTVQSNRIFAVTADPDGAPDIITQTAEISFSTMIASASNSTLTPVPGTIGVSNGSETSTITAHIVNKNNVVIVGDTISLNQFSGPTAATINNVSPITNASGDATFTVSSTQVGTYVFRAIDTNSAITLIDDATVIMGPAIIDASQSTFIVDFNTRYSDDIEAATFTLTAYDQFGNIVNNRNISIAQTSGPLTGNVSYNPGIATTNSSGVASIAVSANMAGVYVFKPYDQLYATTIDMPITVTFTPPTAADSTVVAIPAAPTGVISDGSHFSTVTVTLKDAGGHNFANKTVTLSKLSGVGTPGINAANCTTGVTIGGITSITDTGGQACFKVTSTDNSTVVFGATDSTDGIALTQVATVRFGSGNFWDVNGKPIGYAIDDTSTYYVPVDTYMKATSDGGYVATWIDYRDGISNYGTIVAQKFNNAGVAQWSPTSTALEVYDGGTGSDNRRAKVTSDDAGGAFITWITLNTSTSRFELRGQHIDSTGTALWTAPYKLLLSGVSIDGSSGTMQYAIIPDGTGGAFIGWKDSTLANNHSSITRINSNGDTVTGDPSTYPVRLGNSFNCSGGAMIDLLLARPGVVHAAYVDHTGNCGFLGTRAFISVMTINAAFSDFLSAFGVDTGSAVAASDISPTQCSFNTFSQSNMKMADDGDGGIYIVFQEECLQSGSNGDEHLMYVEHIPNSLASGHSPWTNQLTTTSSSVGFGNDATDLVSDGAGGVIVGYVTRGTYVGGPLTIGTLYVERFGDAGNAPTRLWNGGTRIAVAPSVALGDYQVLAGPTAGTANLVWNSSSGLKATQYTSNGSLASNWTAGGNLVSSFMRIMTMNTFAPHNTMSNAIPNGSGGFVVAGSGPNGFTSLTTGADQDNWIQNVDVNGVNQFTPEIDMEPGIDIPVFTLKTQHNPKVANGSNGDVITAWEDDLRLSAADAASGLYRIFIEKIGSDNTRKWQTDQTGINEGRGKQAALDIGAGDHTQDQMTLAADQTSSLPNGGALLGWRAINGASNEIRIQKIDTNGNRNTTWNISENGRQIAIGVALHSPDIISDGSGGGYVSWIKNGTGTGAGVFLTRFQSSDGTINPTWGTKNPAIGSPNYVRQNPKLLRNGATGKIYVASEVRCTPSNNGAILFLHYVESTGVFSGSRGIGSSTCPPTADSLDFGNYVLNTSGDLIFSYRNEVTGQIFIQKLSTASGSLPEQWGANGILLSSTSNNTTPLIAADNNGGAIAVWEHHNGAIGTGADTRSDLVAQRIDTDGNLIWNERTITDASLASFKINPKIVSDSAAGAVIAWEQWSVDQTEKHIFSQHIVNSIDQGPQYGLQLSNVPARLDTVPVITSTGNGSSAVIWEGESSPPDIIGQNTFESNRSYNSTFTTDQSIVGINSFATLTATLLDSGGAPIPAKEFRIDTIDGANNPTFTPIACFGGSDAAGTTNLDGEACFEVRSTVAGTYTFAATNITDDNLTLTPTVDITFVTTEIYNIYPSSGTTSGGTYVAISGVALPTTGVITVTIGGTPATDVNIVSSTLITAKTPAHAAGPVDVFVSNSDSTMMDTLPNGYTYITPPPAFCGFSNINGGTVGTLGLKNDATGTVYEWGLNDAQFDGNETQSDIPLQVPGLTGVIKVSTGGQTSYALKNDGTVWAWGWNGTGTFGNGTTTGSIAPVQTSISNVRDIVGAGGGTSVLALKNNGTIWAWGQNNFGQLGDGTNTTRLTPIQVSGLTDVIAITAGSTTSYALKSDGTIWAWGNNGAGQVGVGESGNAGPLVSQFIPVRITSLSNIVVIGAGEQTGFAIKNDGTIWAFGSNSGGQFGNGNTTSSNIPVQTANSLTGIIAIDSGVGHTLALQSNGNVWAWGENLSGQVGDGTTINRLSPVQVTTLSGITSLSTGENHSVALKSNGQVYVWGNNQYGQIGNSTTAPSSTPIQITPFNCLVPNIGTIAGGTAIAISGADFQTTGTTTVTFDGETPVTATVDSPNFMTAITPAHTPAGVVDVTITNPDAQTATFTGAYTYEGVTPVDPRGSNVFLFNNYIEPINSSFYTDTNGSFNGSYLKIVLKDDLDNTLPNREIYLNTEITNDYVVNLVNCDDPNQPIGGAYLTDSEGRACFLIHKNADLASSATSTVIEVSADEGNDPDTILDDQPTITTASLANLNLFDFRFRNDDGTEITASPMENTNIPLYNLNPANSFRLRMNISRTKDIDFFNIAPLDNLADHEDELSALQTTAPIFVPNASEEFRAHKGIVVNTTTHTLYVPTFDIN